MPNDPQDEGFFAPLWDMFKPIAAADSSGEKAENLLQDRLRKSGAKKLESEDGIERFQTNEGTVYLGTPQDQARARLMANSTGRVHRGKYKKISAPRAVIMDPELDIDWGEHKVVELRAIAEEKIEAARVAMLEAEAAAAAVAAAEAEPEPETGEDT